MSFPEYPLATIVQPSPDRAPGLTVPEIAGLWGVAESQTAHCRVVKRWLYPANPADLLSCVWQTLYDDPLIRWQQFAGQIHRVACV